MKVGGGESKITQDWGTSLAVQGVKTSPSSERAVGSIPGLKAKIPCASRPKNQNIRQKHYCNKFNEDF